MLGTAPQQQIGVVVSVRTGLHISPVKILVGKESFRRIGPPLHEPLTVIKPEVVLTYVPQHSLATVVAPTFVGILYIE